jgi:hypothetical protein
MMSRASSMHGKLRFVTHVLCCLSRRDDMKSSHSTAAAAVCTGMSVCLYAKPGPRDPRRHVAEKLKQATQCPPADRH